MQFTTVRSKEKCYGIYLKSEKLVHSNQEHEKNISQLFESGKNWLKMQFTAVMSMEKDYDMNLKSEKLVHSNQEHEKNFSELF